MRAIRTARTRAGANAMLAAATVTLLAAAPVALLAAAPPGAGAATVRPGTRRAVNPVLYEQAQSSPLADQGSNPDYRSTITSIKPVVRGLSLHVLQFSDRLALVNHTGETVTVYGYQGEPYARVLAGGAVQLNERSPAVYLKTTFYGNVTVPPSANPDDPPKWVTVYRSGQFQWHDHRIHWTSPLLPPQVKDKSKRTFITDWHVPIMVGTQRGQIDGALYWVPESSKGGSAAIIALVIVALAGIALTLFVRMRRARARGTGGGGKGDAAAPSEVW